MLSYIEYLGQYFNMPLFGVITLIIIFLIINIVGEALEFKGKIVPEFMKIRKYFARRKTEREILRKIPETLDNVQSLLDDVKKHYSADNIMMRDKWIDSVNRKLDSNDKLISEINEKLDRSNNDIVSLLIDSKRNAIIDFASRVSNNSFSVTREQFSRIFKLYNEYEKLIEKYGLTNGEIDVAYSIIVESYENHTKNHTFIEDVQYGV